MKALQHYETVGNESKSLLDSYAQKQNFRVTIGKNKWIKYETFNSAYNLREILDTEIVIEFDTDDKVLAYTATHLTGVNLYEAGITFEVWDHNGRSPHTHIHNLPISHLDKDKRRLWKKTFIRTYVPKEYLPYVDLSLAGIHLIAIEWQQHWKNKYGVKRLLHKFNPIQDRRK